MKPLKRLPAHETLNGNALFEIHAAVLLFGFSGLFGKFLLCSPVVIVLGRTVFAALALLPLLFTLRTAPFSGQKKTFFLYALQGTLLSAHWCAFFLYERTLKGFNFKVL